MQDLQEIELTSLLPSKAKSVLERSGLDFVEREGLESIRNLVVDVFMGRNLRDGTELVTRDRINTLNVGIRQLYLEGSEKWPEFLDRLPYVAAENIRRSDEIRGYFSKGERWLNNWILGLTGKGYDNVLRGDPSLLGDYVDSYVEECEKVAERKAKEFEEESEKVDWRREVYISNTIGSATLSIRGSDKSTFGKLFESPILGSLLHVLDFDYVQSKNAAGKTGVYWLNMSKERESDATLIFNNGNAFRFDIGFIGPGNPEIILDKVTRFKNRMELGNEDYFLRTIILADRLGENSDVKQLAKNANGYVVTMETPLWARDVAEHLNDLYGFDHPLIGADDDDAEEEIKDRLESAPLRDFLRTARGEAEFPEVEVEEESDPDTTLFDG